MTNQSYRLKAGALSLRTSPESNSFDLYEDRDGQHLLTTGGTLPLLPVIDGVRTAAKIKGVRQENGLLEIALAVPPESPLVDPSLTIRFTEDGLDFRIAFGVNRACELNSLDVFQPGTRLNLYDVVNFRNRHHTPNTWPELLIGQKLATTTFSDDWQFAPHPTAFILRKNELSLFCGFLDLQASFGMRLEVKHGVVERWDVDFGPAPHGLKLSPGPRFESARLRLFLRYGQDVFDTFSEFGRMLVRAGSIPDPAAKTRHDWWKEPLYCTWGDQWMLSTIKPPEELKEQTPNASASTVELLDEAMVWKAVRAIQREKLPIRLFLLDAGWAISRGNWQPHPKKFPAFRRLVDQLHAEGFKVIIWWNWADLEHPEVEDPRYMVGGGAWRNKHGAAFRDYSNPATREEYLKPLLRRFFSSEPGCFDLDGIKTDFLADKVHPEMPLADPAWKGEEVYFEKLTRLIHTEMRKHKADAMHLGCAGHYWLAEYIDLNRTYDVFSSDWREFEERAKMLKSTCPGAAVSYDLTGGIENARRHFESARRSDAAVEIGSVLALREDGLSEAAEVTPEYFALLREELARFK